MSFTRESVGVPPPRDQESGRRRRPHIALIFARIAGAFLTLGIGLLAVVAGSTTSPTGKTTKPPIGRWLTPFADGMVRLSFDLPFLLRTGSSSPRACIIYLDEGAARALDQNPDVWDRRLHARLLRRLTAEGVRAVLFDIVFTGPSADPEVDAEFAAAIRENGRTYLGAALELEEGIGAADEANRIMQERTIPPTAVLRRAASGWGLLAFRPVDPDYGVRLYYPGLETVASATWVAAKGMGAPFSGASEERFAPRWLNFYGRADTFPNISYDRALSSDGTPGFFRDRIVIIGGRSTLSDLKLGKDHFRSPYSLIGERFFTGPEVHLTALLNLLESKWLTRMSRTRELFLVLGFGLLLGGGLPFLRPHVATIVALTGIVIIAGFSYWLFVQHLTWTVWAIPAFVQAPVALVWAVGARYFTEERRRQALREAFAHYLSPQMADRIADADFDLALGGKMVEATVMFTDLENFMGLSEELNEPERIAKFLTTYFTLTTGHILESDGTIVKYMGDSMQAVWGAPLTDPDHARKAVRAALGLHASGQMEVFGHPLRTRIGVNTGPMLSGNLGSAQRFDYAVTGDAVNFASRLEGMNKFLGTSILISDSVAAQLGDTFLLRCVGEFRVMGKKVARVIYEVLGEKGEMPAWCAPFAAALAAFRRGDWQEAEDGFRETIVSRGSDGPSHFYLERIAAARTKAPEPDWSGIVELSGK